MAASFKEFESTSAANPESESADFECNICFELAQDPIVTLCGHLYCWPCLYKWLHHHSKSQECPVCKALVQPDKLVPLYGRGKSATDPRSKPVPGVDIPSRPSGQRPPTAPSPAQRRHLPNLGFGFIPIATTTIGSDPLFPGLYSFQMNLEGFPDAHGLPFGNVHPTDAGDASQGQDSLVKWILLVAGFLVIWALCAN